MAYKLNKTDGSVLTDLIDGILDTSTTDLALVGRNYTGYGEFLNENFIKLLENFSNPNEPNAPLRGQLWYDTSENKLKIFDGETFQSAAGSYISDVQPTGAIPGDTWFSTVDEQFYLFDGDAWVLIGPAYSRLQGKSGFVVRTVFDTSLNSKTVLEIYINEALQAVLSSETFTPNPLPTNLIQSLVTSSNPSGRIFKGINLVDSVNFKYYGTVNKAENLISGTGQTVPESRLLKNDENGVLNGSLDIRSSAGVTVGVNSDTRFIIQNGFTIRNTRQGQDFNIVVNSSGGSLTDLTQSNAFVIKANTQRVGIFNDDPAYNLDVTGDCRITGDLIVEGDSVTTNVETVQVEDKNMELGVVSSPTDLTANGGGITLKGATDKTFNWVNSTSSWTSSENIDLASGKIIKHNGAELLSSTRLYDTVTQATGLTRVGTLTELTVDSMRFDGNTISRTSGTGLTISVGAGNIDVSSSKISNLDEPTADDHATPKIYVDREIQNEPIVFSFDTTGYTSPNDRIIDVLNATYAPSTFAQGKKARVVCTSYGSQQTDPIDIATASSTTEVEVNAAAGGTVSVIQGISLPNNLTPQFNLTIGREIRFFVINSLGAWEVDTSEAQNPLNIT
jgi:hypothetical protein